MMWCKVGTFDRDLIALAIQLNQIKGDERIIAKYKEESEGITLLATKDSLIDMIDDTVPEDAIFEVWAPIIDEEDDDNEPRHFS